MLRNKRRKTESNKCLQFPSARNIERKQDIPLNYSDMKRTSICGGCSFCEERQKHKFKPSFWNGVCSCLHLWLLQMLNKYIYLTESEADVVGSRNARMSTKWKEDGNAGTSSISWLRSFYNLSTIIFPKDTRTHTWSLSWNEIKGSIQFLWC